MTKSIIVTALLALLLAPRQNAPPIRSTLVHKVQGSVTTWAASRDGKRVYFVRDSAELVMFDRATGRETLLGELRTRWLDVSPTNDRLAFTRRTEDGRGLNAWTIGLNPATGRTSGTPTRVSMMTIDDGPVFSSDGKSLTLPTNRQSIAIVPANGGPERVVMRSRGYFWPVRWHPDGKALYAGVSFDEETATDRTGIYRIPLDGGNTRLVARTAYWGAYPGLTPDGKHLVYWQSDSTDSIVVQGVSEARLATFVRPPEGQDLVEEWFDANRGLEMSSRQPRVMSLRLTNPERTVALPDTSHESIIAARWAPDGKRVAVLVRSPSRLVLMNADGTVLRRLPVRYGVGPNPSLQWSPNGQRLMYTVGGIYVVDAATGVQFDAGTRIRSPQVRPIWRSDSRGILYGTIDGIDADSTSLVSVREKILGGSERVVRTFRARCNPLQCGTVKLVNDSVAMVWEENEYRSILLRQDGDPRVVYTRPGSGQPVPTFSDNGQWMAVRVAVQGEQLPRRVDVMRIDGSQRRTVPLDMTTLSGPENPIVSNDGRELFVLGAINGGFAYQRVEVATGRSTRIASFQTSDRTGFAPGGLSPDGGAVLYHSALPRYSLLSEIDMSKLLSRR